MKLIKQLAIAGVMTTMAAGTANAQTIGLGTAQAGATMTMGQEIARIISQDTDYQMRSQGFASTGQYGPRVNAGALEFGVSNIIEINYLRNGKELIEGRPQEDLRLAMVIYNLPVTFYASERSGITKPEELVGKRVPNGWTSQPLGRWLWSGFFANVGIDYEDVNGVAVTAMPRQWDMFGQNLLDANFSIFGGAFTDELANRAGGITYLNVSDDPAAVKRQQEFLPYSYVSSDRHPRTGEVVNNISYDFALFTSARVPDELVYDVVKALHAKADALVALYRAEGREVKFAVESGVPFHAGAEKFYREVGMWPPKKQN
ncbi:MAG: TAXI family TRAP transporter solute-binding subunit [Aquisalimonadaceae bacterium]